MSSVEVFPSKVTSLSDFNADIVLRRLGIRPEQAIETEAVKFVFKSMCDHSSGSKHKIDSYRAAIDDAVERLEPRLRLLAEHEESFFKKTGAPFYERDALVLATICDNPIHDMDSPVDHKTIEKAKTILNEGWEIEECIPVDEYETRYEMIFMAHFNTLLKLREACARIDEQPTENLLHRQKYSFPVIRNFLDEETSIGGEIIKCMNTVDAEIRARNPTATIIPFSRSFQSPGP